MITATQMTTEFDANDAGFTRSASAASAFGAFRVNTRLVAAVQQRSGARCHESANLLQAYYFSADVYRMKVRNRDAAAADVAWRGVRRAEAQLRKFLTNLCWQPARAGAAGELCCA
jgi:hypothetical protein